MNDIEINRITKEIKVAIDEYWQNYGKHIEELARKKKNYMIFSIDDLDVKWKCENDVLIKLSPKEKFQYYYNKDE